MSGWTSDELADGTAISDVALNHGQRPSYTASPTDYSRKRLVTTGSRKGPKVSR
jgi:hypothetical protein